MAKLIVLLCLVAVIGVTLARGSRDERPLHRYFGEGRRGEGRASRGYRRNHGFLEGRRGGLSHSVHRMAQASRKPYEQDLRRMPSQRMMENLRADFSRNQQGARGNPGANWPDLRALSAGRERPQWGRYHTQMGLMDPTLAQRTRLDRGFGGDLRGHGRMTGGPRNTRMDAGHGPMGHRQRGHERGPVYMAP